MPSQAMGSHHYSLDSGGGAAPSPLDIRLFYVRISAYCIFTVPSSLTLSISGWKLPLRRDRLDPDSGDVTYVTTDSLRLSSSFEFEVSDDKSNLIICGSLPWIDDGWSMDCCAAAGISALGFVQPKMGIANPLVEVYVAGCFAGVPLILTQTVQMSPRKTPENAEGNGKGTICQKVPGGNDGGYDSDTKVGPSDHPEGWYEDEDGQLSWFNAGVRVGVGIGLGMCVGLGIGVGLLMRSYQATTRGFKR